MPELQLRTNTLLKFTDPEYQAPTHEDVKALKKQSGKTGKQLCTLAGIQDQRTFRRWMSPPDQPGAKQIPYANWRLMLIELELV